MLLPPYVPVPFLEVGYNSFNMFHGQNSSKFSMSYLGHVNETQLPGPENSSPAGEDDSGSALADYIVEWFFGVESE